VKRALISLALAIVPTLAIGAAAQTAAPVAVSQVDSALEAKTKDVASQLRCPVCQGLSLQDSPSELSQEMKNLVREQLRAGKSPDEVKKYFINRYGEWILLDPPAHGFNWVVYGLPVLLLVGGGGALMFALRRWTSPGANVGESSIPEEEDESADALEV
jgi:cytochrome c-type biogenesis protein CcmH